MTQINEATVIQFDKTFLQISVESYLRISCSFTVVQMYFSCWQIPKYYKLSLLSIIMKVTLPYKGPIRAQEMIMLTRYNDDGHTLTINVIGTYM